GRSRLGGRSAQQLLEPTREPRRHLRRLGDAVPHVSQLDESVQADQALVEMRVRGAERVAVGVSLQTIQQAAGQLIQALQRTSSPFRRGWARILALTRSRDP